MTSGFSTAATWLSNITGQQPIPSPTKKELSKDPIIRDLHAMKSAEVKNGVFDSRAPPKEARIRASEMNKMNMQMQPKPKFVAHKDPVKGKGRKEKAVSNRLGGEHMA